MHLLEKDVKEEFDWDPLLDDSRILVKADDGKITLTGSVPSYYESTIAEDDAFSIGGVTMVENQLMVGLVGDAIADADIAAELRVTPSTRTASCPRLGGVDVVEGWVTLSGEVRRHFQRRAAVHAVRRVDGVLGVTDDIVLTVAPIPSDVADRINRAFKRNSIIDDSLIEVSSATTRSTSTGLPGPGLRWTRPSTPLGRLRA